MKWRARRRAKVRVMQQMEAAECGLACLAMVLDYHGHRLSLSQLRERCGTSRDGHSALDLLRHGRALGLAGRGLSVPLESLSDMAVPAILHWDLNHFVVLEHCGRRSATIVDPAAGRLQLPIDEVSRRFTGVALELGPGPKFERRAPRSLAMGRYLAAVVSERRTLGFVVLANVVHQVLAIGLPACSQVLIDHVIVPHRRAWLLPVLATLLAAAVVQIVLQRLQGVSQALLHASLGTRLSNEMGDRLLRLPIPFLDSRNHGDLLERVHMQAELQELLTQTVQALFEVLLVVLLIGLMLAYNPLLGALSLGLAGVRVAILRLFRRPISQRMRAQLAAQGREASALSEAAAGVEVTKGFGADDRLASRYGSRVRERMRWSVGTARLEIGLSRVMSVLDAAMLATILWFGGQEVIAGSMTIGIFSGFMAIRSMVEGPLGAIVSLAESWLRIRGVLERGEDILCVPPVDGARDTASPGQPERPIDGRPAGCIELRGLGFRFSTGGKWVLRDVHLRIEPGQHLAVIGPSGEGKSTLLKLMCGLLEPTEGEVLLDGVELRHYGHARLARALGVVLQEPLIMERSVAAAIAFRNPDCSLSDVVEAARLACFDDVVAMLPEEYEAPLDPLGRNLSGGERQRLAIAQALLQRPALLMLDEGTSSLDSALEQRILSNIATLGATTISVAHREAVVRYADRVVAVFQGQVHEVATGGAPMGAALEAQHGEL